MIAKLIILASIYPLINNVSAYINVADQNLGGSDVCFRADVNTRLLSNNVIDHDRDKFDITTSFHTKSRFTNSVHLRDFYPSTLGGVTHDGKLYRLSINGGSGVPVLSNIQILCAGSLLPTLTKDGGRSSIKTQKIISYVDMPRGRLALRSERTGATSLIQISRNGKSAVIGDINMKASGISISLGIDSPITTVNIFDLSKPGSLEWAQLVFDSRQLFIE